MKKMFLLITLLFSFSTAAILIPGAGNEVPFTKTVALRMDGCVVPTSKHGIHGYFRHIANLISDEADADEEALMTHSTKLNAVASFYALPDSSIHIKNYPTARVVELKMTFRKQLNGLDLLDYICELFRPTEFKVLTF